MLMIIALALLAAIAVWLFLTWYNADDQKMFGPPDFNRVTFKTVLQNALRDVRDVLHLDAVCRWLITNATALAVFLSGLMSMADPTLRQAILSATWHAGSVNLPIGALALLLVTWLATLKPSRPA